MNYVRIKGWHSLSGNEAVIDMEYILLENTLTKASQEGYEAAYQYLLEGSVKLPKGEHLRVDYFLMCLAAGSGRSDKALQHLEEAVLQKGYWFLQEELEDHDLTPLFENAKFLDLKAICEQRQKTAQESAKPFCTYIDKTASKLLLCIHGNGQNASISKKDWGFLEGGDLQVEAVQSARVESYGRFSWKYDNRDFRQIEECVKKLPWEEYEKRILAGFSAGCDMILRTIVLSELDVEVLLLQSPCIPYFNENAEEIVKVCRKKEIRVGIFCGELDEMCHDMAAGLYHRLIEAGATAFLVWQPGLRHVFPDKGTENSYLEFL